MVKKIFLGYNEVTKSLYVNDGGSQLYDCNVVFETRFSSGNSVGKTLKDVVGFLASKYDGRKSELKTNLPAQFACQLETLILGNKKLKMEIDKI